MRRGTSSRHTELPVGYYTPAYKRHITEQTVATAAGLMKDWTTALIRLQTAALGVIGALVGYADFSKFALPLGQVVTVALGAVAFATSLFSACCS
jgi:hypothetical protein